MELRLYVQYFFVLFYIGLGLSRILGFEPLQGLLFFPQIVIILLAYLSGKVKSKFVLRYRLSHFSHLLIYISLYCLLFFPRSIGGFQGFILVPLLIIHVLFLRFLFHNSLYKNNHKLLFDDFRRSLLYGAVFGFFCAWAFVEFKFTPGLIHNLSDKSPFVRSDLDVPFLLVAFFALSFKDIVNEVKKILLQKNPTVNIDSLIALVTVLFIFWMYSRRTPLVACILITGVYFFPRRLVGIWRLALLFTILPLFWNLAVQLLIILTQNEFVDSLLARNNINDYLTASNRIKSWIGGYLFLFDFKIQHLIGYGEAPAYLKPSYHKHMHNMPLDLFFEAGLITVFVAFTLILRMFSKCIAYIKNGDQTFYSYLLMLVAFLFISGVEPTLRTISISHLLFLTLASLIIHSHKTFQSNDKIAIKG